RTDPYRSALLRRQRRPAPGRSPPPPVSTPAPRVRAAPRHRVPPSANPNASHECASPFRFPPSSPAPLTGPRVAGRTPSRFRAVGREQRQLRSRSKPELSQNLRELGADGNDRDRQALCDFLIRQPRRDEARNARLTQAQPVESAFLGHDPEAAPAR